MCDDPIRYIVSYLGAASDEGVDARTLSFLLAQTLAQQEGEKEVEETERRRKELDRRLAEMDKVKREADRRVAQLRGPSAHQPDVPNCGAYWVLRVCR